MNNGSTSKQRPLMVRLRLKPLPMMVKFRLRHRLTHKKIKKLHKYVITGHSSIVANERTPTYTLPKDVYIAQLALCGKPQHIGHVEKYYDTIFRNRNKILKFLTNPNISIYTPGTNIEDVNLTFEPGKINFSHLGIYRLPFKTITTSILKKKGLKPPRGTHLKGTRRLSSVINDNPGIYFTIMCRGIHAKNKSNKSVHLHSFKSNNGKRYITFKNSNGFHVHNAPFIQVNTNVVNTKSKNVANAIKMYLNSHPNIEAHYRRVLKKFLNIHSQNMRVGQSVGKQNHKNFLTRLVNGTEEMNINNMKRKLIEHARALNNRNTLIAFAKSLDESFTNNGGNIEEIKSWILNKLDN
jgi:hypothetical protein